MAQRGLTGPQKAAVLLMQVGTERSAKVLRLLREQEVSQIMAEVARLDTVKAESVDAVMSEFNELRTARAHVAQGGFDRARELLEETLGEDKAREILESLGATIVKAPFEFLRRADPRQVLSYLQDEHPQTIALVLAHLNADAGAMVLSALPEELQRDVARRLATMDRTSPEVIAQIEAILEPKLSSLVQQQDMSVVGGVQALVDILNRSDRATERLIFEGLERDNPELADEVRGRMFVFEDIVSLDDRSIQLVLRQVDSKELAVALKGVAPNVRQKIMSNMSERASANLDEEIELLGPMRLKTVEEAQGAVVRVIRALEEAGQIVVTRSNEEFVN
ncbi:MAG TPA: flagellar motor switch protein FliG [Acidimicrobiia bacterium]|nr:flagellar motor switch protein FliG [Acidimicrobiia bacterium]